MHYLQYLEEHASTSQYRDCLDWKNFGTIKILYMILEHSCRELELVVKVLCEKFW